MTYTISGLFFSERLMKMHGGKAATTTVILHAYKLNGKEVFE